MSRKTLFAILGVIGAVGQYLAQQFGLTIDPASIIASLGSILVYVEREAKADKNRLIAQAGKWKDAKFIVALIAFLLGQLNSAFNLGLSPELIGSITAFLLIILGVLFKKDNG